MCNFPLNLPTFSSHLEHMRHLLDRGSTLCIQVNTCTSAWTRAVSFKFSIHKQRVVHSWTHPGVFSKPCLSCRHAAFSITPNFWCFVHLIFCGTFLAQSCRPVASWQLVIRIMIRLCNRNTENIVEGWLHNLHCRQGQSFNWIHQQTWNPCTTASIILTERWV